jgi:hypothetical protein
LHAKRSQFPVAWAQIDKPSRMKRLTCPYFSDASLLFKNPHPIVLRN